MKEKLKLNLSTNNRLLNKDNGVKEIIYGVICTIFVLILAYSALLSVLDVFSALFKFRLDRLIKALFIIAFCVVCIYFYAKYWLQDITEIKEKETEEKAQKDLEVSRKEQFQIQLVTNQGTIKMNNPFRGIFVLGSAGSGKSESVAVPLLKQLIIKNFSGIIYDFKYPTLANDVDYFLSKYNQNIKHYKINFRNPLESNRVNPFAVENIPDLTHAQEYAKTLYTNLVPSSIEKSDFWSDSAITLLSACIWFLRKKHTNYSDLPHVCALINSDVKSLLELLQTDNETASLTISMKNALDRNAEGQLAGVVGTLQNAIARINTAKLMYVFGGNDFSMDINNKENPILLSVGSDPILTKTLAPLCSLLINVATKRMNQPNKQQSFLMLDESPTIYIPNLEQIPNTGRSNKIATILMCQDYSQLVTGYGDKLADTLFASCANHFYGRVSSATTGEKLSKQFGKKDKAYATISKSSKASELFEYTSSKSHSIQERDVMKPSDFLDLEVGEFVGVLADSNVNNFKARFNMVDDVERKTDIKLNSANESDLETYYNDVRKDIEQLLELYNPKPTEPTETSTEVNKKAIQNNTLTNSESEEEQNILDIFGDGA